MLQWVILWLWPVSAWAAGASLGSTLGEISLSDWLSLAMLSGFSGLVALLHRVRRSYEAAVLHELGQNTPETDVNRQLIDWRLFAVCHMAGAFFIGAISFLGCEAIDVNNYLEAAIIALASWSGAKLADRLADAQSEAVLNKLKSITGK